MLTRLMRRFQRHPQASEVFVAAAVAAVDHNPPAVITQVEQPKLTVASFVDSKNRFVHGPVFKYNTLSVRNLINRKTLLQVLKTCPRTELFALSFEQRRVLFAFLKQETARYYGTARRQHTSKFGKAGEPLPQLQFPTRQDAAMYRGLLQDAARNLQGHVYRPVEQPTATV